MRNTIIVLVACVILVIVTGCEKDEHGTSIGSQRIKTVKYFDNDVLDGQITFTYDDDKLINYIAHTASNGEISEYYNYQYDLTYYSDSIVAVKKAGGSSPFVSGKIVYLIDDGVKSGQLHYDFHRNEWRYEWGYNCSYNGDKLAEFTRGNLVTEYVYENEKIIRENLYSSGNLSGERIYSYNNQILDSIVLFDYAYMGMYHAKEKDVFSYLNDKVAKHEYFEWNFNSSVWDLVTVEMFFYIEEGLLVEYRRTDFFNGDQIETHAEYGYENGNSNLEIILSNLYSYFRKVKGYPLIID